MTEDVTWQQAQSADPVSDRVATQKKLFVLAEQLWYTCDPGPLSNQTCPLPSLDK